MTGIILFRAQPFHNGHLAQIKRAYGDMSKYGLELYIIVGSADKFGTKRNPIPIEVRLDLINHTLMTEFNSEHRQHIHVVPLNDLSDEANNTYSWGQYLYENLRQITKDIDFIFYYSDKPEIALSWFDPEEAREHICFKFLNRVDGVNATFVRSLLNLPNNADGYYLRETVPSYVFEKRYELHDYIVNAKQLFHRG